MKTGIELIAEERERQVRLEGWTAEHDKTHTKQEILRAGICYAMFEVDERGYAVSAVDEWPWDPSWFKPSDDPVRNLVKAGALIAAEIDRLRGLKFPVVSVDGLPPCPCCGGAATSYGAEEETRSGDIACWVVGCCECPLKVMVTEDEGGGTLSLEEMQFRAEKAWSRRPGQGSTESRPTKAEVIAGADLISELTGDIAKVKGELERLAFRIRKFVEANGGDVSEIDMEIESLRTMQNSNGSTESRPTTDGGEG